MSKVWRNLLITAYSLLFIQFLRLSRDRSQDEIELEYVIRPPGSLKKILRELNLNKFNITKQYFTLEHPMRLPTDLKYILKWSHGFSHYSSSVFKHGQTPFIEKNCTHYNCFMSTDKSLLADPRYFDAIIFDVQNRWSTPPFVRAAHQKYIFTASESASNYPYCNPFFDNYFNLTWSYRLDSDIRWSYITIEDINGNEVGPSIDIKWIDPMKPTPRNVVNRLAHKRKAAAWFVSHCKVKSGREEVAKNLANELSKYNLKLDTYGTCGELTCPRDRIEECLELLEQDYYFYLAFENSLCEDYVTEKLLHPLLHVTVPVVFGGANYSRFLPPGSYINAGEFNTTYVAYLMNRAIKNPTEYRNYFRWHNHYVYKEKQINDDICKLCQLLNDPSRQYSAVKNFTMWWTPDYDETCYLEKDENRNDIQLTKTKPMNHEFY